MLDILHRGKPYVSIGTVVGHSRFAIVTLVTHLSPTTSVTVVKHECECGRRFGSRSQLNSHQTLAAVGVK